MAVATQTLATSAGRRPSPQPSPVMGREPMRGVSTERQPIRQIGEIRCSENEKGKVAGMAAFLFFIVEDGSCHDVQGGIQV